MWISKQNYSNRIVNNIFGHGDAFSRQDQPLSVHDNSKIRRVKIERFTRGGKKREKQGERGWKNTGEKKEETKTDGTSVWRIQWGHRARVSSQSEKCHRRSEKRKLKKEGEKSEKRAKTKERERREGEKNSENVKNMTSDTPAVFPTPRKLN